ncbi:adenosylcobinamide-GDP ribazoletransferase [Hansschlegelia plantiphila]|uniref:Adenosylcobinamide-GDP ribazoletransferase n=1 Tax=Hansschlegelia plantiphila TaxID=374655 RepID=A0A9W6IZ55_9HYPH|nr:adenosylcobinamide-GDP ribazoletransferase [Hansschlegelia plantiphila]GLK67845.1 adenosylcobinamide-GDP ribazoletransferase [Hansschlegelia plantiphila]
MAYDARPPKIFAAAGNPFDAAGDALRFFTRLPVPPGWGTRQPDRIFDGVAALAPFAGAVIGALSGVALTACLALGLAPLAAAVFAVAAGVLVSGALHQDGLADVVDGFGGGATRERKLAIMRDSGVGAYGATALSLALMARVALVASLVASLGPESAVLALIAAAALSRPLALLPTRLSAPARGEGAGASARPKARSVAIGCALGLATTIAFGGVPGGVAAAAFGGAAALGVVALARRQIGGYTGDVCGAAAELAEIAALAALAAFA